MQWSKSKVSTHNKRMLHQPLRGLDGFSARASLQNRRKCGRYVNTMLRKLFFILTITLFVAGVAEAEIAGSWEWVGNSKEHTFSVSLEKSERGYIGQYCAVGMSGSRIDCSRKNKNTFVVSKIGEQFSFFTNYSKAKGTAKLTKLGEELIWELLSSPSKEHYAPKKAVLKKRSHITKPST